MGCLCPCTEGCSSCPQALSLAPVPAPSHQCGNSPLLLPGPGCHPTPCGFPTPRLHCVSGPLINLSCYPEEAICFLPASCPRGRSPMRARLYPEPQRESWPWTFLEEQGAAHGTWTRAAGGGRNGQGKVGSRAGSRSRASVWRNGKQDQCPALPRARRAGSMTLDLQPPEP